jgi:flagellar export protein FliJ
MKKFAFTLQPLYGVKLTIEKQQKAQMKKIEAQLDQLNRELDEIKQDYRSASRGFKDEIGRGVQIRTLACYGHYINRLHGDMVSQKDRIVITSQEKEKCQKAQIETRKEIKTLEKLRESLLPFDVLELNHAVWIQASGIALEKEEKVIIIFPRGNLLASGAAIVRSAGQGRTTRENCDCILTDRRLILVANGAPVSLGLERIETCLVSETGGFLGRKHTLILGGKPGIFTLHVPYGGKKSQKICTAIAGFIQANMLK